MPSVAGEYGFFVHEAKLIPPGIFDIKRPLAPGASHDVASALVMDFLLGEASQLPGSCVGLLDILHGEVDVIGVGLRFDAARGRVQYRQDDGATIEVGAGTP